MLNDEKFCNKCREWWPKTEEFFTIVDGVLCSPCKACIADKRIETNLSQPCCVEGCDEPRRGERYSRCYQHQKELERQQRERKSKRAKSSET